MANTPESPYTIQNLANWSGSGAIGDGHDNDLHLSVTERTYIQSTQGESSAERLGNGLFLNSGEFVFTGPLWNYAFRPGAANSTVVISKNGDWTFNSQYETRIGVGDNSTVVFTNESGNVNVTGSANSWHKIGTGVSSYAKVVNLSGNWTFANNLLLADSAGSTGIVENVSGDWSVGGDLRVANRDYGEFTQYGGSLTVGGDMYIHYESTGYGVLTIKGGTVTVSSDNIVQVNNGIGTINLDGGTLVAKRLERRDNSGGYSTMLYVNFNGGTLKANDDSTDFIHSQGALAKVNVGASGGVVDCGGHAIALVGGDGIKGTGGLTFTGGNTITINCKVEYSGATRVTPGTTLAISNATAKANILGNGLVVAGRPTAGQTIVTYNAALTASDYSKISCSLAPDTTYRIGDDGMSIVVDTVGSSSPLTGNYWTGEVDNDLSKLANWSENTVPTENAVIFSDIPVRLTKGEGFAPKSITFLAGSAPVTIDGNFTTLTSVTNNSSTYQTFAGFVDFGEGNIDVTSTATLSDKTVVGGCVVFAGGVKGNDIQNHTILTGHYELTKTDNFETTDEGASRITINKNSSLSVKKTGKTFPLYILDGATFNVENSSPTTADDSIETHNCLWSWSKGTYVISNFTHSSTLDSRDFWLGGGWAGASAPVLKIGSLTLDSDKFIALHGPGLNAGSTKSTIFIGEGGVNIASGKKGYYAVRSDVHNTTLRPWNSDFTFGRGLNADYDFRIGQAANEDHIGNINFTLNTDDEAGVPRTITMDARIYTATNTSSITVAGHGTNIVTSASPLMTGTYAVTDAATVKFIAGAGFANDTSRISLGDGTTLEYTNSGNSLALPCASLVLPESGKATLRINGERLRGGDHVIVSGVSEGAADHLEVELADSVLEGRKYEVLEKDGNLVLTVISGLIIIFK